MCVPNHLKIAEIYKVTMGTMVTLYKSIGTRVFDSIESLGIRLSGDTFCRHYESKNGFLHGQLDYEMA